MKALRFQRSGKTPLTPEERRLIEEFRKLPPETRRALLTVLKKPEPGRA